MRFLATFCEFKIMSESLNLKAVIFINSASITSKFDARKF